MRTSLIRNGLGFGNLGVTIRGTTKYHLSPMEQKAFAGAFSQGKSNPVTAATLRLSCKNNILWSVIVLKFVRHLIFFPFPGLPNIFWRARKSFFTVVPPFILSYLIFTETEKEHDRSQNNFHFWTFLIISITGSRGSSPDSLTTRPNLSSRDCSLVRCRNSIFAVWS